MESDKENLEERNIYVPYTGKPSVTELGIAIQNSDKDIRNILQPLKGYKEEIAAGYALIAYCVIVMFIIIIPNFVMKLTMDMKFPVYCVLVVANATVLYQRKKAENSINAVGQLIERAKNTASELQTTLFQEISRLPKDLFEPATRVIIKAGYISEHFKYPSVFFKIFKNGPLLAASIVSCINLLVIASILICRHMDFQCYSMEILEKIEQVLSMAAMVLTLQIITLALTFKQIDKGYLILDQINVWTEKLHELNQESLLLKSNLDLFITLKPDL